MVLWETVFMKTTVELPDEVMISLKVKAAKEGKKLKTLIEEALRQFLFPEKGNGEEAVPRSQMPVFSVGKVLDEKMSDVREEVLDARGDRY